MDVKKDKDNGLIIDLTLGLTESLGEESKKLMIHGMITFRVKSCWVT